MQFMGCINGKQIHVFGVKMFPVFQVGFDSFFQPIVSLFKQVGLSHMHNHLVVLFGKFEQISLKSKATLRRAHGFMVGFDNDSFAKLW